MKTLRFLILALVTLFCAVLPGHAAPGDLDALNLGVTGNFVMATAVQPDGKTIIAGGFSQVLGQPTAVIARR